MRLVTTIALLILTSSSVSFGVSMDYENQSAAPIKDKSEIANPFASVMADLDGNGVRELVKMHSVKTKGVDRLSIHDAETDAKSNRIEMDLADHWGRGSYPTSIASGNIDEDSNMELAVTRKSSVNMRTALYDFERSKRNGSQSVGKMRLVQEFGKDWGRKYFAQQAAFGDLDGDGRDELVLTTNAPDRLYNSDPNPKRPGPVMIYTRYGKGEKFQPAYHVDGYFKGFKVGYVAIRDMNRDGKMDILVTEKVNKESDKPRYKVFTPAQALIPAIASRMELLSQGKKKFANSFFVQKDETRIASAD